MLEFELILLVVNKGQGTPALRLAKKHGVRGGTIFFGRGTIKSKLLEFLELSDIQREIVIMGARYPVVDETIQALSKELALHKPGHGIVVTIPMGALFGTHLDLECTQQETEAKEVSEPMYQGIFTVVDKGQAEGVVDAAKSAGARGGTIINARGSGIHETEVLFAMPIEPEREVVMIVAARNISDGVIRSIRERLHLDEPRHGIMFVLDIREAHGLY